MARPARRPGRQAQVTGLLVIGWGVAALVNMNACASVGAPPGGPPDTMPPHIVAVHPDSGAMVPNFKDDAVIQFDEVIEEMAGGGGAGGSQLEKLVMLSPVAGPVRVGWHRTSISVKLPSRETAAKSFFVMDRPVHFTLFRFSSFAFAGLIGFGLLTKSALSIVSA